MLKNHLISLKKVIDRAFFAVIGGHMRGRHHVRILHELSTITFRAGEREGVVCGHIQVATTYQSRRDGLTSLRIQKFIAEPTRIDPNALLEGWGYGCRMEGAGAVEPVTEISESRSLMLDFTLPQPVDAGEILTLNEEMDIQCDLRNQDTAFTFQVRNPTDRRAIDVIFRGPYPESALFRLDNGHRDYVEGVLDVVETEGGFRGFHYAWNSPRPGEELHLSWNWPETVVKKARDAAERVNPANDPELASGFASRMMVGDMGPGTEDGEDEGSCAEDHPLIKAARARAAQD